MRLERHPLSRFFGNMLPEQLAELTIDIRSHGLVDDITLFEGAVLDGWHRLLACKEAGVEPRFIDFEGDIEAAARYVVSKQKHRKNLAAGDLALGVIQVGAWLTEQAGRQRDRDQALAEAAGVSERTIRDARVVHEAGLDAQVTEERQSVSSVAKKVRQRKNPLGMGAVKVTELELMKMENLELRGQLNDMRETLAEVADKQEAYLMVTGEQAETMKYIESLRHDLRTVESQRDDYMQQTAQWKKECESYKRKLGIK